MKIRIILLVANLCYSLALKSSKNEFLSDLPQEDDSFEALLQNLIQRYLEKYKCIVFVTDSVYFDVFKMFWFEDFKGKYSFIMVNVNESEDLLAPNSRMQDAFIGGRNSGCQMYVILLANGLQVARLLRFGDRYRVLDTRAKYVMLFDNRLFEKNLFYIWKRIINVIFVKKYVGQRTDRNQKKLPWYELTTVPFPSPITSILVPRRVDIWTKNKFRKGGDLYRDKTSDLKSQILKVTTFSHIPGTVKITTSGNGNVFSGVEIEILQTVSKAMNFRCDIYEPPNADLELWGRSEIGGIYTGLLGEMTRAKADVALGDLYYIPFVLDLMDLSIPYNTECLTFLTPESLTDISWKTLVMPFSGIMWAVVIIFLLLSGLIFHLLAKFHIFVTKLKETFRKNNKNLNNEFLAKKTKTVSLRIQPGWNTFSSDIKYTLMRDLYQPRKQEGEPVGLYQFSEPMNSILYTYSMLLLVSLPKLPTGWSLRMLTGWYWLYCLLLVVAYRASMTAILAKPTPRVTIDSLQELIDSKLIYGGWGEMNRQFFLSSPDPTIKIIGEKFEIVNNSDDAVDKVAAATFAFYENTYFLKEALVKRQLRFQQRHMTNVSDRSDYEKVEVAKSDRNLHIMGDCVINMPISIGLQKNSPIKPRMDKLIRRILEAGLVKKWLDDVMREILNSEIVDDIQDTKALMNLKKFSGAIVALFIGYVLGVMALSGEIVHFRYYVKKNTWLNRYWKNKKKS